MTNKVKELGPQIFEEIKSADNILLHLHPNPDADSVGGALALMHYLKSLGKKVTVIAGDSKLPKGLSYLPGADEILQKSFTEIEKNDFDLFLVLDSSSINQITKKEDVKFPENMEVVVIDHHDSNLGFGDINLVDPSYVANCQLVFDLLKLWEATITPEIAATLFAGIYSDSQFIYDRTNQETFKAAAELVEIYPEFGNLIFKMENSNDPQAVYFKGIALSSIEILFNGRVAIAFVPNSKLKEKKIDLDQIDSGSISNVLKSVEGWDLAITFVEKEPDSITVNFRTRDQEKFDVSKIAAKLGGGGHKAAAGAPIDKPFNEAKEYLMQVIKETYPELS